MDSKFQTVMRKILFVLLVLSYCLPVMAQVNIQTGSATYSIPVFAWKDDRSRLMNAVALQYNSAYGLKVDEVATNIGQGWALLGGGVISRIQAGEPDDQKPKEGAYNDINKYPAGFLYNSVNAGLGCPTSLGNYPVFEGANILYKQHNVLAADREQDYFSFQFNGQSGTFVLGKNNGDKGIMLGDSKVRIWFTRNETLADQQSTRTTIDAFYIQDENGLIYTFNRPGKTKILKIKGAPTTFVDHGVYVEKAYDEMSLSGNPYITTNWYLTQIRDPLTLREINFNYENRVIDNPDGVDIRCVFSDETNKDIAIITQKRSIATMPVLTGIQYPDGHNVAFNYDLSFSRFDLKGDYPMKSIDVTYKGRTLSSCRLNTSYFILNKIGMPANGDEARQARLCLRSVTKVGVDLKEDEPPYTFDYYMGTGNNGDFIPPPFYHFQDIWGYYNAGKNNELLPSGVQTIPFFISSLNYFNFPQARALCFIKYNGTNYATQPMEVRTVNPGFAKNGLLKSITSPLGGVTTYEYEQNRLEDVTVSHYQPFDHGAGVHVSKVLQTNGGSSFDGTSTITTSYIYKKTDGKTSFFGGNTYPSSRVMSAQFYEPYGKRYNFFDGCRYDYTYPGILSREASHNIANENISFMQVFSHVLTVANLAIDVISLIGGNPVPLIIDAVLMAVNIIKSCSADYSNFGVNYIAFNRDAYARNTLPYQFSRVEVIQGDGANNLGRTEYEFTSRSDYDFWYKFYMKDFTEMYDPIDPFSMKQQGASWAYGLPKKVIVRDVNNRKVKETEYKYDWTSPNIKRPAGADLSCHCMVNVSTSMKSTDWMNLANSQNINYATSLIRHEAGMVYGNPCRLKTDVYQLYTGRVEVTDTYERNYKQDDDSRYTETHTHFDYNPNNYQVSKVTTTQSNGDKLITEKYYSVDYNAGGALQSLVYNNIINVPVATYSAIQKNGSATIEYLDAAVNEFTILPNNDVKVAKSYVNRSIVPTTGYVFSAGNPLNFPGLTEIGSFRYDDVTGSLIGMVDEGGHVITNIYDYNDKYIVASVVNADPISDRCAYTSFETQPKSNGWSIAGNTNYVNTSVTGERALDLSNSSLSVTLIQSKLYKLSFWATGNVTINGAGATLVTSGPVVNGFTYYEYDITAVSTTITVTGAVNIDELRLYPKKARMRTVAYDPLVGKTSECDENNRITYYEYDNLGRLRFAKDENGNIIKMYEYNFKK